MGQFDSIIVGQFESIFRTQVKVTERQWVKIGTITWIIYRVTITRKKSAIAAVPRSTTWRLLEIKTVMRDAPSCDSLTANVGRNCASLCNESSCAISKNTLLLRESGPYSGRGKKFARKCTTVDLYARFHLDISFQWSPD